MTLDGLTGGPDENEREAQRHMQFGAMMRSAGRLAGVTLLVMAGGLAAEDTPRPLETCLQLEADAERLTCYDEFARYSVRGQEVPRAAAKPADSKPADSKRADEEWFGLEWRAASRDLETMTAHVVGGFTGWSTGTKFTLDNGQVWELAESSRFRYGGADLSVTIRRGSMSGFLLSPEGMNRSVRVRRLE